MILNWHLDKNLYLKHLAKAFSSIAAAALFCFSTAHAASPAELAQQAKESFARRGYDGNGLAAAQNAANLYLDAANSAPSNKDKAMYLGSRAEALYFVGGVQDDKEAKKSTYSTAMDAANTAVAIYGITDVRNVSEGQKNQLKALPADELDILAEALYQRGINLGQWGQANGVVDSLNKWPELRDNMQLVIDLGKAAMHEYGAYRTLGFGYFKIPELLGGSKKKAEQYLGAAVKKTLATDKNYSVNGYNNVFYAQALRGNDKSDQAKTILKDFLGHDPNTLLPGYEVENRKAQDEARALLNEWQ